MRTLQRVLIFLLTHVMGGDVAIATFPLGNKSCSLLQTWFLLLGFCYSVVRFCCYWTQWRNPWKYSPSCNRIVPVSYRCYFAGGDRPPRARPHSNTEVPALGGRGKSPSLISYTSAINKGQGNFQSIFHLETFRSFGLRDTESLMGTRMQRGFFFYRRVFVKYFLGILFSGCRSKAGYIELLVLLVAQGLVGIRTANGITSRVWDQSPHYHCSCLSWGNSILSDSIWKSLFSAFQ